MAATSKFSVLLVDDDATSNFLNARLFKQFDSFNPPLVFTSPPTALDYLQHNWLQANQPPLPELMLIDINMPVMDGFAFVEALTNLCPHPAEKTILCFLSSSNHTKDKERADTLGVPCYYQKPLKAEHIQELIITLKNRF